MKNRLKIIFVCITLTFLVGCNTQDVDFSEYTDPIDNLKEKKVEFDENIESQTEDTEDIDLKDIQINQ